MPWPAGDVQVSLTARKVKSLALAIYLRHTPPDMKQRRSSVSDLIQVLLTDKELQRIESAFRSVAADTIARLEKTVPAALDGQTQAVSRYVTASRQMIDWLLGGVNSRYPDCVGREEGEFVILDSEGKAAPFGRRFVEFGAIAAPFSPWVERFGIGVGTALYFVDRVRTSVSCLEPLALEGPTSLPHWEIDEAKAEAFVQHVQQELDRYRHSVSALAKARRVMGLNYTELGRLFGTSRQAVAEWAHKGVPVARESKLWMVLSIAELLERKLKPGVVPAIVRRKAETYDGLTILEMIQNDRHNEVLEKTRASFEWAATA